VIRSSSFRLAAKAESLKIADVFARNEITSSNEIRQGMGMKPRPEAKADALQNSNMPQAVRLQRVDPNAPVGSERAG
jgi:hypothetical protein